MSKDRTLGLKIQVNCHSFLQETCLSTSLTVKGGEKKTLLFQDHLRSVAEGGRNSLSGTGTKVRSTFQYWKQNTSPIQPSTICLFARETSNFQMLPLGRHSRASTILLLMKKKAKHPLLLFSSPLPHYLASWGGRLIRKSRKKGDPRHPQPLRAICLCWILTSW